MTDTRDRFHGCLLGGAVGDALGAGVEFASLADTRRRHGVHGVTGYVDTIYGGRGRITDDTQMTLFTAEGLLRARATGTDDVAAIREAYLRWLATQGRAGAAPETGGWLLGVPALHSRRAPGVTCLSALDAGGDGSPDAPANNSKGCGGVMRIAPIGLVSATPFETAVGAAALTHGHPSGYLSAGVFAAIIAGVAQGAALPDAADEARAQLRRWRGHDQTLAALDAAEALSAGGAAPAPESVEQLGGGWVGEEALAIAVFCVLAQPDPRAALLLAVNHSGDSDSTGALTGNLLGTMHGTAAVPEEWLAELELRDVIATLADDLAAGFVDGAAPDPARYS